jgi:phosphatidylglycerophosphate synthase
MKLPKSLSPSSVIEPNYFSNWGDLWYPKLANKLLLSACKMRWLTPNIISVSSFVLYSVAAGLIVVGGVWAALAAALLPISYILDCLDGQLARYSNRTSTIGDYLDKTLDVFKIGIINLALGAAAYKLTGQSLYLILAFMSCFGFLFRYYIKLETIFSAINRDSTYLEKSRSKRLQLYTELDSKKRLKKSPKQKLAWLWFRNRSVFALDEAEHVTFAAVAALLYRPDLWCVVFGVGQVTIAVYRLVERGYQTKTNPESLLYPLRK